MRDVSFRFAASLDKREQSRLTNAIIDWLERAYPSCDPVHFALAREMATSPSRQLITELMEITPSGVSDAYPIFQLQALFSKRSDLELGVDKKGVAIESFYRSERICRSMNASLRNPVDPKYSERAALIHEMQRKITRCLGPAPCIDTMRYGFGPGANIGCEKYTAVRYKLESDLTTTVAAARSFGALSVNVQTWPGASRPRIVSGSRFTTVPKSWKTDRGIMIEPIFNTYVQKGIGAAIRARLKRVGIDLTDQGINQAMALRGSRTGELATIDLSMASDTISYLLVMDLLPWDWFQLLDAARSPSTEMPDGTSVILEKFSSMGNGATFELESLIFWAVLSVVCGDENISVYGDDLICPTEHAQDVLDAITLLGFIPNVDKTFVDGPFRESCGKDYWLGTDVRPVFLKGAWSAKEIFRVYNFFVRKGYSLLDDSILFDLISRLPSTVLSFGPDTGSDGYLIGEWSPTRDKRGWEDFVRVKSWVSVPRIRKHASLSSDYGAMLYTALSQSGSDGLPAEELIYSLRVDRPCYKRKDIRVSVVTR